jgi:hypothetical protein
MKKTLPLFCIILCLASGVYASFQASSYQSVSVSKDEEEGKIELTTPAIPAKSDRLVLPRWLSGSCKNTYGTFSFENENILYDGNMDVVGLSEFFPGITHFDVNQLVSDGRAAIDVKRLWHRFEVIIYTSQGDIAFLFVKRGDGIDVSGSRWRYRKEQSDNGGYSMFRSRERGTIGHFPFVTPQ